MSKRKAQDKKGADVGLAIEQFTSLDTEFYNSYPKEYFLNRLQDILLKISCPEKVSSSLDGTEIKVGKLAAVFKADDNEQIVQYAKIELFETYIHCMESFFRLFWARAALTNCDWLAMARLSIHDYREALQKIRNGNFDNINESLNADTTVLYALTGLTEIKKEIEIESIQNWKNWISYCANELSEVKAYNAYKHGLTIHASQGGLTIQPEGAEYELSRHGDYLTYLTIHDKRERAVWVKKTEFTDLDDIAYKIFVFGQLICSMIDTGRFMHGNKEQVERWYPPKEATPHFAHTGAGTDIQSVFQRLSSYSIELLYYLEDSEKTSIN